MPNQQCQSTEGKYFCHLNVPLCTRADTQFYMFLAHFSGSKLQAEQQVWCLYQLESQRKGRSKKCSLSWYSDGEWRQDAKICASTNLYSVNNCKKCSNSFFAISLQHVTVMNMNSSMDAAIILYIWLVTAVCLEHCWLTTGSWKMLLRSWKFPRKSSNFL